jgi:hypothetical protein
MCGPQHVRRLASTVSRCGTVLSGIEMDTVPPSPARKDVKPVGSGARMLSVPSRVTVESCNPHRQPSFPY